MTLQRFDYLGTGCFPPEPFRFAGRLRNACLALDTLPYDDSLKAIANWCYEDDNVPY